MSLFVANDWGKTGCTFIFITLFWFVGIRWNYRRIIWKHIPFFPLIFFWHIIWLKVFFDLLPRVDHPQTKFLKNRLCAFESEKWITKLFNTAFNAIPKPAHHVLRFCGKPKKFRALQNQSKLFGIVEGFFLPTNDLAVNLHQILCETVL